MNSHLDELDDLLWDDPQSAKSRLESLARDNDSDALYVLAMGHYDGNFGERDTLKAAELLEASAALGSIKAAHDLGCFKYYGYGFPPEFQDINRAVELFEAGVNNEYPPSMVFLAWLLETGEGVDADVERAIELYKAAAEKGSPEAEQALSRLGI